MTREELIKKAKYGPHYALLTINNQHHTQHRAERQGAFLIRKIKGGGICGETV